jgi:hypothetical protein
MLVNLRGRVNNIKLAHQHGLHPLFEAIINSIHAIEERHEPGRIDVAIRRELSQAALDLGDFSTEPIDAFEITDNGIGFNNDNYESFETSDTMYKASQGGKGIGRLLWLKAFRGADITSTFQQDGAWRTRTFRFTIDGIAPSNSNVTNPKNQEASTTVRLYGFLHDYRNRSPKAAETIAKRIIEHCLEYFVLGNVPAIIVHEDRDLETHDLKHIFDNEIQPHSKIDDFTIRERPFRATHLLVGTAYESQHRIHYCAHKRAVHTEALAGKLPDLPTTLKSADDAKRSYVYAGYIAGDFLDETVTPERTSFDGLNNDGQSNILPGQIPWPEVTDEAVARARIFLTPYTSPVKQAKQEQVQNYVRSQAPQYRALVKHRPDIIEKIPPNLPNDKLDLELYKHDQTYKAQLRAKSQEILAATKDATDIDDFDKRLEEFLEEWNDAGMAELARYIAHRKAILSFLDASIGRQEDGKYQLEKALHNVIFPLKTTSDDVAPERMNLWVLDERLVYHHYLASDLPFRRMADAVTVPSSDRPDLIIFHAPAAFVESAPPFNSVTLIEFKRPVRDDYTDDDNPISQVYRYIETIRAGQAKDRSGRPITIPDRTPFFAYIVCDVTPSLKMQARTAGLRQTADAGGFFGYNENFGVYVDIVSFDKLLGDAKKRNAILFEKLGLTP